MRLRAIFLSPADLKLHASPSCKKKLDDLLPESSPIGCPYRAAGAGEGCECHDLVDLAAGDFYFHRRVQEIGRMHDELERFAGGENRPHAGQSQTGFIAWNRHGVEPALIEMLNRHTDEFAQDWLKTCAVLLVE